MFSKVTRWYHRQGSKFSFPLPPRNSFNKKSFYNIFHSYFFQNYLLQKNQNGNRIKLWDRVYKYWKEMQRAICHHCNKHAHQPFGISNVCRTFMKMPYTFSNVYKCRMKSWNAGLCSLSLDGWSLQSRGSWTRTGRGRLQHGYRSRGCYSSFKFDFRRFKTLIYYRFFMHNYKFRLLMVR